MSQSRKRPWLAAALSFIQPGIGHLYLREWARAALWFGLSVTTWFVLVPPDLVPETASVDAWMAVSEQLPLYVLLTLLTLVVMSMLDAYALANRHNQAVARAAGAAAPQCPSCGHDLEDPELDFCPWCAEPLESDAS